MELEEIKKIIALLEESTLNKLSLKKGDFELLIEKESFDKNEYRHIAPTTSHKNNNIQTTEIEENNCSEEIKDGFVSSPMVGTYYSKPSPNDPTFVKVGDIVDEDTVICIIEAMKVMNEVKAGVKGKIKEALCKNAQPVEFGTNLFRIESL